MSGFNYSLSEDNREQIRGGFGLFAGRTPYVWLSNQYGNTGIEFQRISVPRATAQQAASRSSPTPNDAADDDRRLPPTNEIDLIDPDYKYPSLMRGNLAYDRELGFCGPGRHAPSSSTRRTSTT